MIITRLLFIRCAGGFAPLARVRVVSMAAMMAIATPLTANTEGQLDYKLEISADLHFVAGQVCGVNLKTQQFRSTRPLQWVEDDDAISAQKAALSCLNYRMHIDRPNNEQRFSRYSGQAEKQRLVLASLAELLPCPVDNDGLRQIVSFGLAPGIGVSVPGKPLAEKQFSLASRPCNWTSGVLIGEVTNTLLSHGDARISVAMPSLLSLPQQQKLMRWLARGLNALSTTYGVLPVKNIQVLIFPTGPNEEPVPWGQVMRGGGDSVHLYVDETKTLEELNADWVLVHELSHLLHPYLYGADSWLSEGIASYYQNVLRARDGLLDQKVAWKKLLAGFRRGENQFNSNANLKDDTRQLMRDRKYMRVYWSGAAIALLADVHLRRESHGTVSLDTVLRDFSACCLPTKNKKWRARDLMKRFDELGKTDIFLRLHEKYVSQAVFPSLQETYRNLGLKQTPSGIKFDSNPSALRKSIMTSR